ncbi:ECF family RNA polymerase sigma factor [Sorangium cellulosum]|uniref:ECF family RNA polymerase sigma factor n=1 Tax=Sorangium cellulosum TaxID=56 RepID=A0A2L0F900_SORCE|nr:RNA polymerase sigma factor [Sorangium cellulosum]AUX47929.1 ECF family RNA polymerase sigma factor [Sorangium cellulosum]
MALEPEKALFEAIWRDHREMLATYLLYLGVKRQDLEDVMQEVLHGVYLGLSRFDPELGTMRSWLIGIATHHFTHYRDRAHRRREVPWSPGWFEPLLDESPSLEALAVASDEREALDELLAEVIPERRAVLVAHTILEMDMSEIAQALSIPVQTAWSRLRLARRDLDAAVARRRARCRTRSRGWDEGSLVLPGCLEVGRPAAPLRDALRDRLGDWLLRRLADLGLGTPAGAGTWGASALGIAKPVCVAAAAAAVAAGVATAPAEPAPVLAQAGVHAAAARHAPPSAPPAPRPPRSPQRRDAAAAADTETRAAPPPAPPAGSAARRVRERPGDGAARLAEERRLIEKAAVTLRAGHLAEASEMLERHARQFPRGQLAGRREALLRELNAGSDIGDATGNNTP